MAIWAEGCYPSRMPATPRKRSNERRQHPGNTPENASNRTKTPAPLDDSPRRRPRTPGPRKPRPAANSASRTPAPAPAMGDKRTRTGVAGGTVIGGVARTRGDISSTRAPLRVGDKVRNTSGRGVWGFGSIVAVIPHDVWPRAWCKRHGLPLVFSAESSPQFYERYIVRGDDGRLHTPMHVERIGDGK